jgi:cytoskeletal protein RodZ
MIESVGSQLRRAREAQALTMEQASRATHIRLHYLQALEAGDFDALPSMVQARGFVRAYATYLGLSPESMLAALNASLGVGEQPVPASQPPVVEDRAPQDDSIEAIFQDIGQRLKRHRELLGLSIEDVERHTHLRQRYLVALEAGDLESLPSPVQGRGMLNNYASFLGLDPEPLLLRFAEGLQAQLAVRQATRPVPTRPVQTVAQPPGSVRRLVSAETLLAVVVVLFLVGFVIWGAVRIFTMQAEQEPVPTAPSIAEVLLSAPTSTATSPPLAPTPTVPPLPQTTSAAETPQAIAVLPGEQVGLQVYVTVRQRAWVRVTVDGEVVFQGRVLPGSAYQYEGEETVEVLTSNGAALQIFFNQQDLGPMGLFGQVVQQVFTVSGVQTPTPTVTLTPTVTPRFTPTPQATAASP